MEEEGNVNSTDDRQRRWINHRAGLRRLSLFPTDQGTPEKTTGLLNGKKVAIVG